MPNIIYMLGWLRSKQRFIPNMYFTKGSFRPAKVSVH